MLNEFDYDNLIGRPPGRYLRIAAKFSEGIRSVQNQIPVYAADWLAANAAEAVARHDKPLWVVLGDSMAQGIGADSYLGGWPGQLREKLRAAGREYRLINLSISGARVGDVLDRQLPALRALNIEPALVTVMIGSNDLARKAYRQKAPAEFAKLLAELPTGSVVANLPGNGAMQLSFDKQLHTHAKAGHLIVANMRTHGPHSWRGKLASDHFHPNDAGYAVLAAAFARAMDIRLPNSIQP
jgi:lysophospholipase L1-like esterase